MGWLGGFLLGNDYGSLTGITAVTRLQQEVQQLEEKLARKDEVLGEVLEEYVTLKKSVGAR